MKLILRKLRPLDEKAFFRAMLAWDHDSGFRFFLGYKPEMSFLDYLTLLDKNENGINLPTGIVPDTVLAGFVGDDLVGRLAIRHQLNDFLLKIGGHIGYGVLPEFRKKGYATEMLRQSLPMAKELGIDRALVTCDDTNIGSIKTIEACGGILENKLEQPDAKPLKRRYWITLP
jgi:predicted acetyltransferase